MKLTNQQYLADLPPEECYDVIYWLFHDYGRRYNDTRHAVIDWMYREVKVGEWQRVHGYATAGGDPVWICPACGFDKHVYGIEHPSGRHTFCSYCGCFNNYYQRKVSDNASENNGTDS